MLNSQYSEINFTCDFLDLELQRQQNGEIEIAAYHKPTGTNRYIPSSSYAPIQHKLAAFHSLAHRLVSLPLSMTTHRKEYKYIQSVANINEYGAELIDKIIKKHVLKKEKSNLSTLFSQPNATISADDLKRTAIIFYPAVTNHLKIAFRRNGSFKYVQIEESADVNERQESENRRPRNIRNYMQCV